MWGDARRLGLWNTVRKAWAPRRVAVTRTTQISRTYTYVAVALNPLTGQLWWAWQANMKSEEMTRVWDGAGSHKSGDVQALPAPQVVQPPYAPELNPVERFFQELRRALGDRVYPTLEAKKEALEPILKAWQATRRGCGNCAAGAGSGTP